MAKWCPETKVKVLYPVCLECEHHGNCKGKGEADSHERKTERPQELGTEKEG